MDALRQGIYNKLTADSTLVSLLSTYRSYPAIVDGYFAPDDIQLPYLEYHMLNSIVDDSKTTRTLIYIVDFRCFVSRNTDPITLAERVRTVLHRQTITVSGWTNHITSVEGPVEEDFGSDFKSMTLTATIHITN